MITSANTKNDYNGRNSIASVELKIGLYVLRRNQQPRVSPIRKSPVLVMLHLRHPRAPHKGIGSVRVYVRGPGYLYHNHYATLSYWKHQSFLNHCLPLRKSHVRFYFLMSSHYMVIFLMLPTGTRSFRTRSGMTWRLSESSLSPPSLFRVPESTSNGDTKARVTLERLCEIVQESWDSVHTKRHESGWNYIHGSLLRLVSVPFYNIGFG
ncbi:hypothetical protein HD806DRAFT_550082 [Xylariaceae sp. AK1471]|nr:hypothetical protein HD806DRAFT_550082 [Xylariaceae sp. AK1471]